MGYRTVVMLSNDHAAEWVNDPQLGQKIQAGMNFVNTDRADLGYGRVVECTHASEVSLALVQGTEGFRQVAFGYEGSPDTDEAKELERLFKAFASKLGYRLVRKVPRHGNSGNLFS